MAVPWSPEKIHRQVQILNTSRDADSLAASATALAGSEDQGALLALGRSLRSGEFLNRLDNTSDPSSEVQHLIGVFRTLAAHPNPATGRLCELLYTQPDFVAIPTRINLLLGALAAVRPTTTGGAEVFRTTSREGYAEVNGPLLLLNESPLALGVFEEMIAGDFLESYVKVDMLHRSVLPRRIRLPVLQSCARLLESPLPPEVRASLVETLFDYQSRRWFGPAMYPPVPPSWDAATIEVLDFLIVLAARVLTGQLDDGLRAAVNSTRSQLETIRRQRVE